MFGTAHRDKRSICMDLATSKANKETALFGMLFEWMPRFDLPRFDPTAFRDIAEQNAAQTRDVYEKVKTAADDATEMLQRTCTTAVDAATKLNVKLFDAGCMNANAALDFAQRLLTVKSPSELTELTTAQVRKQCEFWGEQAKEFSALTHKVTRDTIEPVSNGLSKVLKKAA
jgi:phasin